MDISHLRILSLHTAVLSCRNAFFVVIRMKMRRMNGNMDKVVDENDEEYGYEYYDEEVIEFEVNQRLKCFYIAMNEWYEATILEVEDDRILLQYDEYTADYNEWIVIQQCNERVKLIE